MSDPDLFLWIEAASMLLILSVLFFALVETAITDDRPRTNRVDCLICGQTLHDGTHLDALVDGAICTDCASQVQQPRSRA